MPGGRISMRSSAPCPEAGLIKILATVGITSSSRRGREDRPMASSALRGSRVPSSAGWEYDVVVEKNVRVPMRDGVNLAADLYLPARNGQVATGRFPAIMERTPYDKEGKVQEGRYFARR